MTQRTVEINTDFLNKCLQAVSKDVTRFNISGVYIHDKEGERHYVGTNGHILVHCHEKSDDDVLEQGIIIKPCLSIRNKKCLKYTTLQIVDENTAILHLTGQRILCDIIDGCFPDYWRIIPTDVDPEEEYVCFEPDYLKIAYSIIGSRTVVPLAQDTQSPHIFRNSDDVEVIIMPLRI